MSNWRVAGELTERSVEDIRPSHRFDVTCQGTVPTALVCALESTSFEDAVRNAVSLGGDADTLAAIAGAVGEALHGLPEPLVQTLRERYLRDAEDITGALDALYGREGGTKLVGATGTRDEGVKVEACPAPVPDIPDDVVNRAQGCLLGQIAGDSLGSLVEFENANTIRERYPDGPRELADGGVWNTLAGQPTDDSEMALALARSIVRNEDFSIEDIHASYVRWKKSRPFDMGNAIRCGLRGNPILDSQANGALMRISPLGIFGWRMDAEALAKLAAEDAALTHPHRICQQVSGLYASAIAEAIREKLCPKAVYDRMVARAGQWNVDQAIRERIENARTHRPPEYSRQMGWVLTAFQNALYELLHAPKLEDGVIETVRCGGDTDTNGAICGALLGAVYGRDAVPEQWVDRIAKCRPTYETAQPRPKEYWPNDALRLAEKLLQVGGTLPRISFLVEPLAKFAASLDDCLDPDEPGMKHWGSFADVLTVFADVLAEFDDGRHKVDRHRLPKFTVSDENTSDDYEAFCSAVDQLTCRFRLCTDQVDQALFGADTIGPGSWRRYVIRHRLRLPR